jgi:UDP-glucose 4-epimerase
MKAFFALVFSISNTSIEEEEKMSLFEDIVISVKEAYALAKTIDEIWLSTCFNRRTNGTD